MFKFDSTKFKLEFCMLLSLSKATIDPKVTFIDSHGIKQKKAIPVSIARLIRARLHGASKFAKGYPCAFGLMDSRIVAMDVALGGQYKMWKATEEWISIIEERASVLKKVEGDWLWDGQYAYRYVGDVVPMGDTDFGHQEVRCFNLYRLGEEKADMIENLSCLCYKNPETDQWVRSAPVTRKSGGFVQITGDVDVFNKTDQFMDDDELARIDVLVFPNLRFVNYASRTLTARFGYTAVEPLGLPLLMIEHQTFNVGGIPTEMQAASPAPMSFTNALSWMIGLNLKVRNLDDLIAIKATTKMLLTKGNTLQRIMGKKEDEESVATKELIASIRSAAESRPLVKYEPKSVEEFGSFGDDDAAFNGEE